MPIGRGRGRGRLAGSNIWQYAGATTRASRHSIILAHLHADPGDIFAAAVEGEGVDVFSLRCIEANHGCVDPAGARLRERQGNAHAEKLVLYRGELAACWCRGKGVK